MIRFLYRRLGHRFALWFCLVLLTVAFDSLSISLLLPLIAGPESESAIKQWIEGLFGLAGVEYSLISATVFVICAYTIRTLVFTLQGVVAARSLECLLTDSKRRTVNMIGRMDYECYCNTDAGVLNNAVTLELNNMITALNNFISATAFGFAALGMFLLAFVIEPKMVAVTVAIAVPCYYGLRRAHGYLGRVSAQNTRNNGVIQSLMSQMLASFKYLKATQTNDIIGERIQGNIQTQGRLLFVHRSLASVLTNSTDLALVLTLLGFVLFYTMTTGRTLLEIVFIMVIIRRGIGYGVQVQERFQQFLELSGSVRLFHELERGLQAQEEPAGISRVQPDLSQPIRFENVFFGYRSSGEVLRGIDLVIQPGSRVVVLGPSGAGKSTFAAMLTGLLRPTSGVLRLGGTPYSELDMAALRSQIGYVTQESVIFNDSVANNVSLWDPCADYERVRQALAIANAVDFVDALPDGLDTVIGDDGAMLSGGQRQRIAIAREMYKSPLLLVLDEATSAMEGELEDAILSNIDRARGSATLVLVSHRLPVARDSDAVYVMDRGRMEEQAVPITRWSPR